jgi:hypothetical protein
MMKARYFSGSKGIQSAAKPGAGVPGPGTVICLESNRPAGDIESISCDFDAAREVQTAKTPRRGQLRVARAVPMPAVETTEPAKMRLNTRYGISAVRAECAPSAGTSKWPRRNLNLPLAAGARVRHIRADGAVAEWLKAAVC